MDTFVNRYATPVTLGLFGVSAISGTALFLHLAPGVFHEMHEWLSILLLLPFALHVWKNRVALTAYARRGTLLLPLAAALVAAVAIATPALSGDGGEPPFQAIVLMTATPLSDLAPVLRTTPEALQANLAVRGYNKVAPSDTLDAIAAASGASARELLFGLMPPP